MKLIQTFWKTFVPFTVLLGLGIALQAAKRPLHSYSIDFIKDVSKNWNNTRWAIFLENYFSYGFVILPVLAAIYILMAGPKIAQILWINQLGLGLIISAIGSTIFHELRPSWEHTDMAILIKHMNFGTPSIETTLYTCVILGALLVYLFDNSDFCLNDFEVEAVSASRKRWPYYLITKLILMALTLTSCALLIYSEIYTGTSTINQVLYGFLIAVLCMSISFYFLRGVFIDIYKNIMKKETSIKIPLMILGIMFSIIFLIETIVYEVLNKKDLGIDKRLVEHIKNSIPDFTAEAPIKTGLVIAGFGFVTIGASAGLILSQKLLSIDPTRSSIYISPISKFLRLFFAMFMLLPAPYAMMVYIPLSPIHAAYWFKSIIPSTFLCFSFFLAGDLLMQRLGLLPKITAKKAKSMKETPTKEKLKQIIVQSATVSPIVTPENLPGSDRRIVDGVSAVCN